MELLLQQRLDIAAGGSAITHYLPTYRRMTLKEVRLVPLETSTAHGSNHVTFVILNGSTTLASRTTNSTSGGTTLTVGVSESLALSGGAALDFEDLGEIKFTATQNASGVDADVEILLVFEPAREV